MMHQYTHRTQRVSTPGANLRHYDLVERDGSTKRITLEYHVWTTGGSIIHDEYRLVGKARPLSRRQIQTAVEQGVLIPVDDCTSTAGLTPSRQAEAIYSDYPAAA